jgi:hypothetical protein
LMRFGPSTESSVNLLQKESLLAIMTRRPTEEVVWAVLIVGVGRKAALLILELNI